MSQQIPVTFVVDPSKLIRSLEAMAAASRRAAQAIANLGRALRPRPVLVVDDPADRWAESPREFLRQLGDIVRHEFWIAQGKPERSPGAWWRSPRATPLEVAADFEEQMRLVRSRAGVSAGDAVRSLQTATDALARNAR